MIDANDLNEYSKRVYEYFKKNTCDLLERITIAPSDFDRNYIEIELVTKNKNSASNLYFSSEHNQLTVGFDNYHCHFDNFSEMDFEQEIKKAIECFYQILNEEFLVVSAGGGATTLLTHDEVHKLENGHKLERFDYDCINYYVISWSGKFDKIFKNRN